MNEQQAAEMIGLLKEILDELKDISYNTDATKSEVNDA